MHLYCQYRLASFVQHALSLSLTHKERERRDIAQQIHTQWKTQVAQCYADQIFAMYASRSVSAPERSKLFDLSNQISNRKC
jgi:hypothetical protein